MNQTWSIEWTPDSRKQLLKLDRPVQKRILSFLHKRIIGSQDPYRSGKKLTGALSSFWAYRIGDYRAIVDIKDRHCVIVVIHLDHRRQVYRLIPEGALS